MYNLLSMEGTEHDERKTKLTADHMPPASIPAQSIERLTEAIDRLNRQSSLWFSFWHGLLVGIGSTAGVALVVYGIIWLLDLFNFVPGASSVREFIQLLLNRR